MTTETLTPAAIRWADGRPHALNFDDIYFSPDSTNEVERVFLTPSALKGTQLTIAEIGFGTALNFATLGERILKQADTRLHFISCEAYPLRHSDWQVMATNFPQLTLLAQLAATPPPLIKGWHRRTFAEGRINLSVFHGDAHTAVMDLAARHRQSIDAWLLDGFAPDRNPEMWHPELLATIAETCRDGTTVATFTAAGRVRRGLEAVGFSMRKVDQRPFKRESLAGTFIGQISANSKPGDSLPVVIYGAGIAGAMVARHLADANIPSAVVDPHAIAAGASTMRHTLMHPRLLGDQSIEARLRSHAFHYATAYTSRWLPPPAGAIQIQGPNLDAVKLARIAHAYGAHEPDNFHWIEHRHGNDEVPGLRANDAYLALPLSRVVDLANLCATVLDHPHIEYRTQPPTYKHLRILCTATATRKFPGLDWLELADVGGQIDRVTFSKPRLAKPVVGSGYYIPTADGAVIGSTYEYEPWDEMRARAHNIEQNAAFLPADFTWQSSQRARRSVTSDRIPLVGQVDEHTWLCTGMGSMGTTFAPLAGAIIASQLRGILPPASAEICNLMDPMRIAQRQARRGPRHR